MHDKDKEAALTPKMAISRGRRPNSSGDVTRARATSVRSSRSQQTSPTRARSLSGTCDQADKVSSNSGPTANQVRPNATTNSQQPSEFGGIISGCNASGSAIMRNNIILNYSEKSRKCIRDLKLTITNPYYDKRKIERRHGNVCEEHLRKVREHESYKRWRYEDDTRLLWIYSHTKQAIFKSRDQEIGDQKRIVAAAVVKELEQSRVNHDSALSYMFCENSKNAELKLNDTAAILRGLMWLLTFTQESLTACLEEKYTQEGKRMFTDEHATSHLSDILSRWLEDTNVSRVYLVVGAIDESYMKRKDIMDFLDLIIMCCKDLARVKWLITSDCDDFYFDYIQANLSLHKSSFAKIYLNQRSKKKKPRRKTKPAGKGTEGTNQEIQREAKESAQVGEGYLSKRKGRAGGTISEENIEELAGEFLKGAEGDKNKKPDVSGGEKGPNQKRAKGPTIPDETTPLLPWQTSSSPSKPGESTPTPQQDGGSKQDKLNTRNGSAKRWCWCCLVQ